MNWKLIFRLSLFGLAMGIATVYFIPSNIEFFFWLAIFIICGYLIAKNCTRDYFLQGFCVSLLNAVWVIASQLILFNAYMAHHAKEAAMYTNNPMLISPKAGIIIIGIIAGLASGIVLGSLAFIASRILKKNVVITHNA
jgi:hypothetical protein